jgi:hypothetical protein
MDAGAEVGLIWLKFGRTGECELNGLPDNPGKSGL